MTAGPLPLLRRLQPRWSASSAYGALWLLLAYATLRYLALERHVASYGDTPSYRTAAHAPIFSEQFLAGYRSLTVPLFWKLVPGSDNTLTIAQLLLSFACWFFLARTVANLFSGRAARFAAYLLVLGFSLIGPVAQWDRDLLSESVNFSLFALVIALGIRVVSRPRALTLGWILVAAFFWVSARDSNAYAALAVGVVLAVALIRAPRRRRMLAVALAGCTAIFAASAISAHVGHRGDNPVAYVVSARLPVDKPSALVWMRAHGYTKPEASNTSAVYQSYLLHHLPASLTDVFRNRPSYSPSPASENRLDSLYAPKVSAYEKSQARWRIPAGVQRIIDPAQPLWVLVGLGLATLLALLGLRRGYGRPEWLIPPVLVLAAYPQTVVIWNVDAYEDDRHALGPALEVRLAIVLMVLLAAARLLPVWLREAQEAPPAGVAQPRAAVPMAARLAAARSGLRAAPKWFSGWIALLALVGLAGRIAFYRSPLGVPDADEAVGGLMAKHELHGQFVSAFLWGQAYGGTLETWLAAPLVGIFGPSYLALRIVPIVLSALAAVVVWRIGLRTLGRHAALAAAGLAWCFPSFLLWKTSHFHIFYASGMVLGTLTILQVLRVRERVSGRGMLLLGLLAGLALWQSFQLATIVPPALIWLAVRRRDLLRYWPTVLGGFLLGFAPVIASNIRHDLWSRDIGHPGDELDYLHRLFQFFTNGLPISLDLRTAVTLHWLAWKPLALVAYVALLGAFVLLLRATRRDGRFRRLDLVATIAAGFPGIYAISPLTSVPNIAGYVIVFMPLIALLLCSSARDAREAFLISAAALVVMAGSVTQIVRDYSRAPRPDFTHLGTHDPLPRSFQPLLDKLDALGIRRVYASYWIAYRIDFESDERIIAADMRPEALRNNASGAVIPRPDDPDYTSRHPDYAAIVNRVQAPAFVLVKAFDPPSTDYGAFASAGGYRTAQVGVFTIYYRGARSRGTGT